MTTIKVEISGVTHYLELYDNDPLNLNLRFTDIEEIQRQKGSFSKSFRIPANDVNRDALGDLQNPNIVEGIDLKSKIPAELLVDTIPIERGFVQVKRVVIRNGKHAEYQITFFGDVVSLSRTLGDAKLSDLDFSLYDHTVGWPTVAGSWSGTLFGGNVRYGMIDKGFLWSNDGDGTPITSDNPVYTGQFTPGLRLARVIEAIFEQNGFSITGNFVDSDLNDYYIPFYNGKRYVIPSATVEDTTFGAGLSANDSLSGPQTWPNPNSLSNWDDSTSPFYDNGGVFDAGSGVFQPPFTGQYQFTCFVTVTTPGTNGFTQGAVGIRRVGDGTIIWQSSFPQVIPGSSTNLIVADVSPQLTLDVGQDYELVFFWGAESGDTITIESAASLSPTGGGTGFFVQALSEPLFGQTAVMSNNAPDIKQIDFIRGLQGMFNLLFIPDKNDPTSIEISTFADYTSGGAIKDWSDQIDHSKDITLDPTTDIQKREYQWTYAKEKDIVNQIYQDEGNRVYGRYEVTDPENDFATGEYNLEVPFGAYPLDNIGGTDILIHKSYDSEGNTIQDPLCKVVLWKYVTGPTLYVYNDFTMTLTTYTGYPYWGHYSDPEPQVDDVDLNFGPELPTHTIGANPFNNLFNSYWRAYVNQLYSAEARIMEAYFKLSVADIANFNFSDQIWARGSYWRVLEINYTPNENEVSKVKLIKILGDVRACDWLPHQSNVNGIITMIDENGVTGTGTQECCERFGYVWVSGACYQPGFVGGGLLPQPEIQPIIRNSIVRGNAHVNGDEIQMEHGSGGFISGRGINVRAGALRSIIVGDQIEVRGIEHQEVTGTNAFGFVEGDHRGHGWWYENWQSGNKGAAQTGEVVLIFEGDFDNGDTVELFIEGKQNNRLQLPEKTSMSVSFEILLQTRNVATGDVSNTQQQIYYDQLERNNAGVASSLVVTPTPSQNAGDWGAVATIRMSIDTTTDTNQHRIKMVNSGTSNTETTRIVCKMNYTMARL